MGKMFSSLAPAAEALGIEHVTLRMQKHFWSKGERGGRPLWFIEIPREDVGNQEIIDAAKEETHAAAQKLYTLKRRVIQEAYDKGIEALTKEYSILLKVNDEAS
jgi:hypothetical protein